MRRSIPEGIYLIIDPSVSRNILLGKLKEVVLEPIAAVQIWDNFKADDNWMELVEEILIVPCPKYPCVNKQPLEGTGAIGIRRYSF
ncbi:hypothetical protein LWM68_37070 [Niabella sp. W65]|nr:hypothetical protein [Niabella sp. W65]MCH7367867.1 hypothetical protein [Niabella sp. W65]